jgi:hypothetical protein
MAEDKMGTLVMYIDAILCALKLSDDTRLPARDKKILERAFRNAHLYLLCQVIDALAPENREQAKALAKVFERYIEKTVFYGKPLAVLSDLLSLKHEIEQGPTKEQLESEVKSWLENVQDNVILTVHETLRKRVKSVPTPDNVMFY